MGRTRRAALGALALHAMAENAFWVALMVWAFRDGGASRSGVVAVVCLLTSTVCAPIVSATVDRLDQVSAYRLGAASQTVLVGLVSVLLSTGAPSALVITVSAIACGAMTATRPAYYGLLPNLLDGPQKLISAARKSRVAEMAGNTSGPFLSAVALAIGGPKVAIGLAASMLAGSFLCTLAISKPEHRRETLSSAAILGNGNSLGRQLRSEPGAIGVLLIGASHFAVIGALDVLYVVLATNDRGATSLAGVLSGCFSLGAFVGAAFAGRRVPVLLLPAMRAGSGAFLILLAATALIVRPLLGLALLLAGSALATLDAGNRTMLPRSIPSSLLGRVMGLQETAMMIGCAVGATLAPIALELFGLTITLLIVGSLPVLVVIAQTRNLRRLDRRGFERSEAVALVSNSSIFDAAPPNVASAIAFAMEKVSFDRDTTIIRQHDGGACLYLIAEGSADVSIDGRFVRSVGTGDHIGEVALLRNSPRTATIIATSDVVAWRLDSAPFLVAVTSIPNDIETLAIGGGRYTDLVAPESS